MSSSKTLSPKFFHIQVESQGSTGEISYDSQSETLKIRGLYLPRNSRYVADDPEPVVRSNKEPNGKLCRIRPRPKEYIKLTQDEWSLFLRTADLVCLWGIRGTDRFSGICDGAGHFIDIEFEDRILQSPISGGEYESQWRLFDAACRAIVGESRIEIFSRGFEPVWDTGYCEKVYFEVKNSPKAAAATTIEILEELQLLWEKAVTPPDCSIPVTISDWEFVVSYWQSRDDRSRHQLCQEVLASLLRENQCEPSQIRPWWKADTSQPSLCTSCGRPQWTEKSKWCFSCGADWEDRDLNKQIVPILNGGLAVWLFLSVLMCTFIFMGIAFAKRPFNATQYVFFAFFACAAVGCLVKGLLYCARRLELSKSNLAIKYLFRTVIIHWSIVKSAAFIDNRGHSKYWASIYDAQIPVPVGGILPNVSYFELLLRLDDGQEIYVPVSSEYSEVISQAIRLFASLDPAFELARCSREKERDRVESSIFGYVQGVAFCVGGVVIVGASLARAIKINSWNDLLVGFAFAFFLLGLGTFCILKEVTSKRLRRLAERDSAEGSEVHAEGSGTDSTWAERIRGRK